MSTPDLIFHAMFGVMFFGVPVALVAASYSPHTRINVSILWTSHANGKVDTLLVILVGTWWVHTCAVTLWTLTRNVSTADFITYMGWALPIITTILSSRKQASPEPPAQS